MACRWDLPLRASERKLRSCPDRLLGTAALTSHSLESHGSGHRAGRLDGSPSRRRRQRHDRALCETGLRAYRTNGGAGQSSELSRRVRFVGTHHLVATGWSPVSAVGANGTQVRPGRSRAVLHPGGRGLRSRPWLLDEARGRWLKTPGLTSSVRAHSAKRRLPRPRVPGQPPPRSRHIWRDRNLTRSYHRRRGRR